jgi:hypothetical protein
MLDFSTLLVNGIPLSLVIFGLVEMIKSFGVQGKVLTLLSLLLGLVFGLAYQFAQTSFPTDFAGWFSVIIFGLTLGLVTSGFYKFADKTISRISPLTKYK